MENIKTFYRTYPKGQDPLRFDHVWVSPEGDDYGFKDAQWMAVEVDMDKVNCANIVDIRNLSYTEYFSYGWIDMMYHHPDVLGRVLKDKGFNMYSFYDGFDNFDDDLEDYDDEELMDEYDMREYNNCVCILDKSIIVDTYNVDKYLDKIEENTQRKIFITEEQMNNLFLLNESLSNNIYHFTSISTAFQIMFSNKFLCQSSLVNNSDDMNNKYDFYISFTRNKSPYEGFGYVQSLHKGCARFEFDGDKLNHNFKGNAVNYWGAGDSLMNKWYYQRRASGAEDGAKNGAYEYRYVENPPENITAKHIDSFKQPFVHFPTSRSPEYIENGGHYYQKVPSYNKIEKQPFEGEIASHRDNEIEDRLFTNKAIIENILSYVKRVDILCDFSEEDDKINRLLYNLIIHFGKYVFVYDNLKDFNFQTDNTLNEKIGDFANFDKWKYILSKPKEKEFSDASILGKFFKIVTLNMEENNVKPFIAKTLRRYGFEKLISSTISKLNSGWGSITSQASEVKQDLINLSKEPTESGHNVLKMISDILRKMGYHGLIDAAEKETKKLNLKYNSRENKWSRIDTSIKKKFKFFKNGWTKYDITNDSEVDMWHILGYNSLQDKYDFIDRILSDAEYYTNGEWINNIRNNDKEKFKKYLQSLAHDRLSFKMLLNILKKIGFRGEQIREILEFPEIGTEICDYFEYRLQPPYQIDNYDEEELRQEKLFSKI